VARLRVGKPLWFDRSSPPRHRRYPSLRGRVAADVVIVGGGLTGAVLAWKFSEANLRIAVLESGRVGCGSTAVNSALLMREPDRDLGELTELYGARAARRIWQLGGEATRDFIATLRRLDIACELEERRSVYYTLDSGGAAKLRAEHRRRRDAGFGAKWLDAAALHRMTGIRGAAAIVSNGNAQLNPYAACIGLLRAARSNGAQIFERSAARRITPTRTGIEAVTSGGTVIADRAVIATGYATPEFKPLTARFKMLHTYASATGRIGARARERLGLGDVMLWDTGKPYHYARWTSDHRLLFGGNDVPQISASRRARAFGQNQRALREYFDGAWPPLRDVKTQYEWEGLFAMTPDGLPYIGPHRRYPGHLFALGYGGNGMTFAFLAARLLLDRLRGGQSGDHDLFSFGRHRR
jgi:glycine/D-amino acid oxidase-like deaminating enzyme